MTTSLPSLGLARGRAPEAMLRWCEGKIGEGPAVSLPEHGEETRRMVDHLQAAASPRRNAHGECCCPRRWQGLRKKGGGLPVSLRQAAVRPDAALDLQRRQAPSTRNSGRPQEVARHSLKPSRNNLDFAIGCREGEAGEGAPSATCGCARDPKKLQRMDCTAARSAVGGGISQAKCCDGTCAECLERLGIPQSCVVYWEAERRL